MNCSPCATAFAIAAGPAPAVSPVEAPHGADSHTSDGCDQPAHDSATDCCCDLSIAPGRDMPDQPALFWISDRFGASIEFRTSDADRIVPCDIPLHATSPPIWALTQRLRL